MKRVKVRYPKKPKLVLVEWLDTQTMNTGWKSPRAIRRWVRSESFPQVHSVGWIMATTKRYIVLVAMLQNSGDFMEHVQRIPRGTILKIRKLRG